MAGAGRGARRRAPAVEGFVRALDDLAVAAGDRLPTAAHGDVEAVHELRVALRRSRSVLGESRGVLPGEVRRRARAELGWLAGVTGATRDLDVLLATIADEGATLHPDHRVALDAVILRLAARRDGARSAMAAALVSDRAQVLLPGWRAELASLAERDRRDLGEQAGRRFGRVLADRIERRHARLVRDGRAIDAGAPAEQLHELRKDAKRLRYVLEIAEPLVGGDELARATKRLRRLQEVLGAHQDADVQRHLLRTLATSDPDLGTGAACGALDALVVAATVRGDEARAEFAQRFERLDRRRVRRSVRALCAQLRD